MISTIRLQIGRRDPVRKGYPLELFPFPKGKRLAPPPGEKPDLLPDAAIDVVAMRERFGNDQTLPADLLADGQQLWKAIDTSRVGSVLRKFRSTRQAHTLLDVQDPELESLPWELLAEGSALFFTLTPPHARYRKATPGDDPSIAWPLRLLVVVGAKDDDDKALPKLEVDRLREDLLPYRHSIDLEIKEGLRPGRDELIKLIRTVKPHVFHFIGHAGVSTQNGQPALRIDADPLWWLDASDVGAILNHAGAHPRFVFLNACRTGDPAQALKVADAFVDAGTRATLTMRGNISGLAAGRFAGDVYKRIWEGQLPDVAVAEARGTLRATSPSPPQTFAYPLLTLSTAADEVLPTREPLPAARVTQIERCKMFQDVTLFSGRSQERRRIRTAFQPIERNVAPSSLVLVTGTAGWGKSHVVKRSLECLALGGHNVRYVPLGENGKMSFLDVLVEILTPDPTCAAAPIDPAIFYEFTWRVTQILQTGSDGPWDGVTKIEGPIAFDANQKKTEDPIGKIFTAFNAALNRAAADCPLLVVLDQFRDDNGGPTIDPELVMHQILMPYLIHPLLNGSFPRVSMAIVMWTSDASGIFHMEDIVPQDRWLSIADLDRKEFDDLADELLGYTKDNHTPGISGLKTGIHDRLEAGHFTSTAMALCELLRMADDWYLTRAISHRTRVPRAR
jgi:CHAT domain-containing protein/AAA ATPase-like protein